MNGFLASWLVAFAFTQTVEIGIYTQAHPAPRPLSERIAIAFAASGITHPIVWFVIPDLAHAAGIESYWTMVAICEAWAVIGEAVFLGSVGVRRPLLWALAANTWSFVLGLYGYRLLDWTEQIQAWLR